MSQTAHNEIIRPRNIPQITGLSKTTIWRLERAGKFPKHIQLSAGATGWKRTDIEAWVESRQSAGIGA